MAKKRRKVSAAPKKTRSTQKANSPKQQSAMTASGLFRGWQTRWQNFLAHYPNWWKSTPSHEPVYWLPEFVVMELTRETIKDREHRGHTAVITSEEAQAENAFRECCGGFGASVVGVWEGIPVRYELLGPSCSTHISDELIQLAGWDQSKSKNALDSELGKLQLKTTGDAHQRLAYAGKLTIRDEYQKEKLSLYAQWRKLNSQIDWPLLANTADREAVAMLRKEIDTNRTLPDNAQSFLEQATTFMRKWDLYGMATWELPLPQGPLEHLPAGPIRHFLGPNNIVSAYPNPYDIPSSQDVRKEIRDQQRRAAREKGIGADFPLTDLAPRAGHASMYENVFRLWFIEGAVLQRYRGRKRLATRLIKAFAEHLNCKIDRINQLRREYKGHLAPVSYVQPID